MPELRKDPVVGRWVIIATERARRPGNFVDSFDKFLEVNGENCPFCQNHEIPIYVASKNGSHPSATGDVRVVPVTNSFLNTKGKFVRQSSILYDVINGFGMHELVIETPDHVANMADLPEDQIRLVLETYVARMNEFEKNPSVQYVLAYKNYGERVGNQRVGHSRSHIIGLPVNPLRVKEKLTGAKDYFDRKGACIYCDLLRQELNFKKRIIAETDHFVALTPFAARFLFEVWILPKKHSCDYAKGVVGFEADLAKILKILLMKVKVGLDERAYTFVVQTAPFRRKKAYSQKWETIEHDFHWHIEIIPQLTRVAGFEKGTGFYICSIPPESMAEYLREVEISH